MMGVSTRFAAAMRDGTHTPVDLVEVIGPAGDVIRELDIEDGDVTEDEDNEIRHSCDLTIIDPTGDLTPVDLDDMLMPLGTRLRISRGVRYDDGTEEMVTLMTAWQEEAVAERGDDGRCVVPLVGFDRWMRLQRESQKTINFDPGEPFPQRILDMLRTIDPGLRAHLMDSEWATPRLIWPQDVDLAAEAREMARAVGAEVFVSRLDDLVVRPIPVRTGAPVWTFDDASVIEARVVRNVDNVPNGIVVIGQHSSLPHPVRGEAWDMDPTSPTFRFGPAGENPRRYPTEKVTTVEQATAAARGELERLAGGAVTVEMDVWPPPVHLLTGDLVHLDQPEVVPPGDFVIQRMVTPLGNDDPARVTLRQGVTPWLIG